MKLYYDFRLELQTTWLELDYLILSTQEQNGRTIVGPLSRCEQKCSLNPACKAFMVRCEQSSNCGATTNAAWRTMDICIFFGETFPYALYRLDRSQVNMTQLSAGVSQRYFTGPEVPYPRLMTLNTSDFYLDTDLNRTGTQQCTPTSLSLLLHRYVFFLLLWPFCTCCCYHRSSKFELKSSLVRMAATTAGQYGRNQSLETHQAVTNWKKPNPARLLT
eukprot:2704987-Amphidinium_carterae.3